MRRSGFVSLAAFGLSLMLENTCGMHFDKASNSFKSRQVVSLNGPNRAVENSKGSDEEVVHLIEVSGDEIANLNSQVNWLTQQVQGLNGKMVSMLCEVADDRERLSNKFEWDVAGVNSQIADLTGQLQNLNNEMSKQKQLTETSNNELMNLLEKQRKEEEERLNQQEKQNLRIADLAQQLQNLNNMVGVERTERQRSIGVFNNLVSGLNSQVAGLTQQLQDLNNKVSGQEQLTKVLHSDLMKLVKKQEERERLEREERLKQEQKEREEALEKYRDQTLNAAQNTQKIADQWPNVEGIVNAAQSARDWANEAEKATSVEEAKKAVDEADRQLVIAKEKAEKAKEAEEARKKAEEDAKKAEEEARKKAGKSTRDDTRRKVLSGFKR